MYIYIIYTYMSAKAGQTDGPNWLTFFEGIPEYPGVTFPKKNFIFKFKLKNSTGNAGHLS